MKPEFEDILFIKKDGYDEELKKQFNVIDNEEIIVDNDTIQSLLIKELNNDNYKLFINYFKDNYESCIERSVKNLKKSLKARTEGHKLFLKERHNAQIHEDIWRLYTESIALAPPDSEELALAYSDRANILMHFKKYVDCIKDIDKALTITKLDDLKIKLLCRKMNCFATLNDSEQKENTWAAIKSCFNKMDKTLKNEELLKFIKHTKSNLLCDQLNVPQEINKKLSVSYTINDVAIKCNEKHGRYLVVNRNIEPGEQVMVLKPYVTSVNSNKFYAYCSHCLLFTWSNIPCDHCSLSMFCSEKCKLEAWENYHHMECKISPHIQFNNILYYYYHLSIKAVIKGIKEVGSILKLKEELNKINKPKNKRTKELKDENLFNDSFKNLYTLSNKCNLSFLLQSIKSTCFLLTLIINTSEFFEKNLKSMKAEEIAEDDDVIFIGVLIVKLIIITASKLENIDMKSDECEKQKSLLDCIKSRCCSRGVFITAFGTLINNDCNPNVCSCFTHDGKIMYYCCQPMKKNTEIFISYFTNFFNENKETRQSLMNIRGNVKCNCKACIHDWPAMKDLYLRFQKNANNARYIQNKLAPKILPKYIELPDLINEPSYQPDENMFHDVIKDVTEVVKTCGQPSFVTSVLIDILDLMFELFYKNTALQVPEKCQDFVFDS